MSKKVLGVPKIKQLPGEYCGVASLCMVFSYYGFKITQDELVDFFKNPEEVEYFGVYPSEVVKVAKQCGFNAKASKNLKLEDLIDSINDETPLIVRCKPHWDLDAYGTHFYIAKGYDSKKEKIFINDSNDLRRNFFSYEEFMKLWNVDDVLGNNYAIKIR